MPEIVLSTRIHRFNAGPWPALTGWRLWLWRAITLVIPKGNPDFEGRYEHVTNWWLEVGDDGLVHREIGFDAGGQVLVAAPFRQNLGMFTDLEAFFVLPPGTVVFIATCGALATLILITVGFKCPRCGSPLEIARARGIPAECDVCHLRFRQGLE